MFVVSDKANKLFRIWDMLWTTFSKRKEIGIVIIDTYSTWSFYYAVAVAKLCRFYKLPYVPVLHGGDLPNRLRKSQHLCKKLFGKSVTNVAPSKYMLQQFQEAGYSNLTHIPNSIPIENYPFLIRERFTYKLLWVRSFAEIYNPKLALEIVELLMKKGKDVELCMVGPDKDGTMEQCKEIAQRLKLPVIFTGVLEKEEWVQLSKEYSVFINTTNFDNMPISVIEAMALGLPVVSTNVGGLPYLINDEENGILVVPNQAEVFVEALVQLVEKSEKAKRITQRARKDVEKLDWSIVKNKWISLIDSVLVLFFVIKLYYI